ncbi:diaminopimelate epimerase [Candidatus Methylomirabilis lanthanidiphila]|uniref:Diaminopimelate epimerase n=1 Tax=Candidatus Methylomirabilis lanthanidiphila TaxID=2211376 RepID=A0A564ZFW3_9BACT|nr:diaminopimelate epimerase [Candidatus Methylomirabilis lanthanidiphila]VUZ84174.1 diaminopimelate epimerase [Candidatus Methylomirabilis lanthanidiphila]
MDKLSFVKMSGSGNDFIMIDNRGGRLDIEPRTLAERLCRRRISVGADGLILVEPSATADFRMRILNADGSEAEMCGNGGRCVARFAEMLGIAGSDMTFETLAGLIRAQVDGSRVKLQTSQPRDIRLHRSIEADGDLREIHSINTGVPHAVLLCEDLEAVAVRTLGRTIRFHPAFQPAGTNVDFVTVLNGHTLTIRTYERGVEDETLACGTGTIASALVAAALGLVSSPVQVRVRSGEILTVSFTGNGPDYQEVFFEGQVRLVYQGELMADALLD